MAGMAMKERIEMAEHSMTKHVLEVKLVGHEFLIYATHTGVRGDDELEISRIELITMPKSAGMNLVDVTKLLEAFGAETPFLDLAWQAFDRKGGAT